MGLQPGIKAFVAAVLGGIGNIPGAALGGVLLGVIETLVVGYSDRLHIPSGYRDAVAFFLSDPHPALQADRPPRPRRTGESLMFERSKIILLAALAAIFVVSRFSSPHRALLLRHHPLDRHQHHPRGEPQPGERLYGPVLAGPRRVHVGGSLRRRVVHHLCGRSDPRLLEPLGPLVSVSVFFGLALLLGGLAAGLAGLARRHPVAAVEGRLPGHCDARFWRDHQGRHRERRCPGRRARASRVPIRVTRIFSGCTPWRRSRFTWS